MSTVKREIKLTELKVGFTSLSEYPREVAQMIEEAVSIDAKAEISLGPPGAETTLKMLGTWQVCPTSTREMLELSIPHSLKKSEFYGKPVSVTAVLFGKASALLCVQTQNVEWLENRIRLRTPWRPFKFQRRTAARLEIASGYDYFADVKILGRQFKMRIADLSATGMSLRGTSTETDPFTKGLLLDSVSFQLDSHRVSVTAKVTHSKGGKVGLRFEQIAAEDVQLISSFVARYLVQYSNR